MTARDLIHLRLHHQLLSQTTATSVVDVVSHLCAMQAQDYAGAKWSIGLRLPGTTDADIEQAILSRLIVRTTTIRGTLHFVSPADVRWIAAFVRPRIVSKYAGRYKQLELDDAVVAKSNTIFEKALASSSLTRKELEVLLVKNGVAVTNERMNHFLSRAALDQVICCGARRGKEFTYELLDSWAPSSSGISAEEARAKLALRYFTGHGPATVQDFASWAGLTLGDARAGLLSVTSSLSKITFNDMEYWMPDVPGSFKNTSGVFLLPGFDEYFIGYADRTLIVDEERLKKLLPLNGIFSPTIVVNGRIEGTWKRTVKKNVLQMESVPFQPFSDARQQAMVKASKPFSKFMGLPVEWEF
ncbi:winged helix DNA-binding domain-containing protein [Chitinophaga sp. SYP-B3965]|uniref:winged helix DNA-binding domain-containing protein n=1 Tax=Chitinophaga sp. SYP-B3965 TaxID=2663120 RepID=UPI0012999E2C|nr:winged helix DNA-binding domain-containing protein [Chitinophaga sp. SYP-B3965]MRG46495.1 winged helix DNA-binding domain-containing protein [Chitinophaga sp. SYP-B3965]